MCMDKNNIAATLAAKGNDLQLQGNLPLVSFGKGNKVSNFIEEAAKALKFGLTIVNDTDADKFIAFGGRMIGAWDSTKHEAIAPSLLSIFENEADLKAFLGNDLFVGDGLLFEDWDGTAVKGTVTAIANDSKRPINRLLRYMGISPTRLTKFSMRSRTITGEPDSSNYDNRIKTFWASPLEDTVSNEYDLSSLVVGGNNFNTDMLDVDFQKLQYPIIIGPNNFLVIQVNAKTKLNITMSVGAQLDIAQMLYRLVNKADAIMAPVRRQIQG